MDECAICYENMDHNGIIKLNCGHMFHKLCVIKINNNKCPLCRAQFDIKKILNIDKNIRICTNCDNSNHIYSPYVKNGECRFCFGRPIEFFLSNNTSFID